MVAVLSSMTVNVYERVAPAASGVASVRTVVPREERFPADVGVVAHATAATG